MKTTTSLIAVSGWAVRVLVLLLAAGAGQAQVREVEPRPALIEEGPRERPELAEVTFLGISTHRVEPELAAKMKLPRESGLLVSRVMAGSPAEGVLKPEDLLTHLDGQVLSGPRQLGVLVRSYKEGDVVRIALVRGGKAMTVRVALGRRMMPPLPGSPPPVLP